MANELVSLYRKKLAALGQTDERDDSDITAEFGRLAQTQAPELFKAFPDFGQEFGAYRELNAPSLVGEGVSAVKRGIRSTAASMDSFTALAARTVGLSGVDEFYKGRAKELGDLNAQEDPATVPTVSDIAPGETGAARVFNKDTARYLIGKGGEMLPMAGLMVGTGAGAGALAGRSALAAAEEAGLSTAAKLAAERAAAIAGGETGAFLATEPLTTGSVYQETNRPDLAWSLGTVGALAGAAPVLGLPARVVRSLYPTLTESAAKAAATELVGKKTAELLAKLGRAGVTEVSGTVGMVGMEAANIVAKNISEGKDALTLEPTDWARLREAAIGGALATTPFAALSAREPPRAPPVAGEPGGPKLDENAPPPPPPPGGTPAAPVTPPSAAPTRTAADVYREVRAMSPEEQKARLAALTAQPARTPHEETEVELLQALVPPEATPPQPPVVEPGITPPVSEVKAAVAGPTVPPAVPDETALPPDETTIVQPPPENAAAEAKLARIKVGIATPGIRYQYSVFPADMAPVGQERPVQIDIIGPDGKALGSTNLNDLAALGVNLPRVPDSMPMGKYSPEEVAKASEVKPASVETPEITFKDAGYETPEAFKIDYEAKHARDVFESESEFISRIFCSSQA